MALDSGTYIYTDAKLNVVYSNSMRAKRVTLKVNPKERNIKVTVPGLKALPTAKNFVENVWQSFCRIFNSFFPDLQLSVQKFASKSKFR